ncbi:hypothetical protein B0T17DRAFT_522794 [Bombardia bombarda]|uniref:NADH-ubiquinone oxidoreductase 17.8 kDa subunit n=1 Tax=Bombardia bombarda TaxID=252184 RepID=A0AA39X704_9PEZI|nr:hypothetical protein B0T17DRAFT_522794 [Bombardia bombarda]
MSALRNQAARIARRTRPTAVRSTRTYASESHGSAHHDAHHAAPEAEESLGAYFYVAVGAIPASMLLYSVARPGKDDEPTRLTKWLTDVSDMKEKWETRNHNNTVLIEQAAQDKNLYYGIRRSNFHELTFPEVFQAGSPFNVPAGHNVNLDKVVAHYRKQHLDEEERKVKKMAAAAATSE